MQGLGPVFRLSVSIQNTAPSSLPIDLFITFKCDESLYRIKNKFIQVNVSIPRNRILFNMCFSIAAHAGSSAELQF